MGHRTKASAEKSSTRTQAEERTLRLQRRKRAREFVETIEMEIEELEKLRFRWDESETPAELRVIVSLDDAIKTAQKRVAELSERGELENIATSQGNIDWLMYAVSFHANLFDRYQSHYKISGPEEQIRFDQSAVYYRLGSLATLLSLALKHSEKFSKLKNRNKDLGEFSDRGGLSTKRMWDDRRDSVKQLIETDVQYHPEFTMGGNQEKVRILMQKFEAKLVNFAPHNGYMCGYNWFSDVLREWKKEKKSAQKQKKS